MKLTLLEPMVEYLSGRIARGEIGPSAIKAQRLAARGFVYSFGARPLTELGRPAINRWAETISYLAPNSQRAQVSSLRGFLGFLHEECYFPAAEGERPRPLPDLRPMLPKIKLPRRVPRALGRPDVIRLLTVLPDRRAHALVALGLYNGLRAVEMTRLRVEDYDGDVLFLKGKGGHERIVPVGRHTRSMLDQWLAERGTQPGWMFPSCTRQGAAITPNHVSILMARWFRAAGVKTARFDGKSCHALRHTCATDAIREQKIDVRTVQALLGHSQLSSTMIYIRPGDAPDMLRAVERDYHPDGPTAA